MNFSTGEDMRIFGSQKCSWYLKIGELNAGQA